MKFHSIFRALSISVTLVVFITITTCKKDELTQEEKLTLHEQKILTKSGDLMPEHIVSMLEDHFVTIRNRKDYSVYLDSIEIAIDELKSAVEENFSIDEYKKVLNSSFSELQKKSSIKCIGLGYAKGIKIDASLAGEVGAGIVARLHSSGGGGVKTIYDFVNLDRQVYYYCFCSDGYTFGAGSAAVLSAGIGFTGINEVITGIRYLDNSSKADKFEGYGQSKSYSLSSDLAAFFDINPSLGIGTSAKAVADFSGIRNLELCPQEMIPIENETKGYSFNVSGSLSDGIGAALTMAFNSNTLGSYTTGMPDTYENFADDRTLAGCRMAKELVLESPLPGLVSSLQSIDLTASSVAVIYGLTESTDCPSKIPSIGTKPVSTFSNTTAGCGGIITYDGRSWVTKRGIIWSTDENPDWGNKLGFTIDGQGTGEYNSALSNLIGNTIYYVRAYATNSAGTGYGSPVKLKTADSPNHMPLKPINPFPVNGVTEVSTSPILSWSCADPDDDPMKYDVYLDTNNPPLTKVSSDQANLTFHVSGLLNGVHYFWKVIAKDNHNNSVDGNVWNFTTENPVLVNTFGPNDSYLNGQGWTLGYSASDFYVHAIGFKPGISGNVIKYKIAVFRNTEESKLDAMLLSDSNNRPGALIEKISFNVPNGSTDLLISANSINHPHLVVGTRYWLVVAPPDITGGLFGWYRNPHISGMYNAQARSWNLVWITCEDAGFTPVLKIEGASK
jgi:hypothetical protein